MTVKELITALKQYDENFEVVTCYRGNNPITDYSSIEDMYGIIPLVADGKVYIIHS